MGVAVAPAVGTAFGSSALASMAAAPIFASVAAPIAASTASMMMSPSILSAGGGSFFGGMGGLLSNVSFTDLAFGAANALSGIQTLRQGNMQAKMYELQNLQTLANLETQKLNFELDGLERLKKLQRIQSARLNAAYGGGVSGLDGSAKLIAQVNDQQYGDEYKVQLMQMQNLIVNGKLQGDIYSASASSARTGSYLDAGAKLGEAAYLYNRIGGAPTTAS